MAEESRPEAERNKQRSSVRGAVVVHPFLFAVWPVLFIYSRNVEWVRFSQTWTAMLGLLGTGLLLLLLLTAILRNWMKAGAVLSLLLILFFSYGHAYNFLWRDRATYAPTAESLGLMVAWALAFVGGSALVLRIQNHWREITAILNAMAAVLVAASVFSIGDYMLREPQSRVGQFEAVDNAGTESVPTDLLPNIYYIILDSYAREDLLEEAYGYDNSEFLSFLTEQGFYIAGRSQANYAQTELSIASSLNLDYLDELVWLVGSESGARRPIEDLIQRSFVTAFLEEHGYAIVGVTSGFNATDLKGSDVHVQAGRVWNEVEVGLLCSTPIPWLAFTGKVFDPYAVHRQKILFALDHIADTADFPGPQFVFAHVLAPHDPFVFDENGNAINPQHLYDLRVGNQYDEHGQLLEQYVQGYTGQLAFISSKIKSSLENLIARSSRPTIVILQSDHGPGGPFDLEDPGSARLKQKMTILNAYLFPDRDYANLYQEITPVNTFRVILNQYLGTDLELLEDESYYSTWSHPYRFVNVTDIVRSNGDSQPPE